MALGQEAMQIQAQRGQSFDADLGPVALDGPPVAARCGQFQGAKPASGLESRVSRLLIRLDAAKERLKGPINLADGTAACAHVQCGPRGVIGADGGELLGLVKAGDAHGGHSPSITAFLKRGFIESGGHAEYVVQPPLVLRGEGRLEDESAGRGVIRYSSVDFSHRFAQLAASGGNPTPGLCHVAGYIATIPHKCNGIWSDLPNASSTFGRPLRHRQEGD